MPRQKLLGHYSYKMTMDRYLSVDRLSKISKVYLNSGKNLKKPVYANVYATKNTRGQGRRPIRRRVPTVKGKPTESNNRVSKNPVQGSNGDQSGLHDGLNKATELDRPTVYDRELDDVSLISWPEVDRAPMSDDLKLDLTTLDDDNNDEDYIIATADLTSSHFNSMDRFIEKSRNLGVDPLFIEHLQQVGNYYKDKKERVLASKQNQEPPCPAKQPESTASKPGKISKIKKLFRSLCCLSHNVD